MNCLIFDTLFITVVLSLNIYMEFTNYFMKDVSNSISIRKSRAKIKFILNSMESYLLQLRRSKNIRSNTEKIIISGTFVISLPLPLVLYFFVFLVRGGALPTSANICCGHGFYFLCRCTAVSNQYFITKKGKMIISKIVVTVKCRKR